MRIREVKKIYNLSTFSWYNIISYWNPLLYDSVLIAISSISTMFMKTTLLVNSSHYLEAIVSFFLKKYLFICQRERERAHKQKEWQAEGEAASLLRDSILGPRDDLS